MLSWHLASLLGEARDERRITQCIIDPDEAFTESTKGIKNATGSDVAEGLTNVIECINPPITEAARLRVTRIAHDNEIDVFITTCAQITNTREAFIDAITHGWLNVTYKPPDKTPDTQPQTQQGRKANHPCIFFEQGNCRLEDARNFQHILTTPNTQRPPKPLLSAQYCITWGREGTRTRGKTCYYKHRDETKAFTKGELCRNHQKGVCTFEDKRFHKHTPAQTGSKPDSKPDNK